MLRRNIDGQRFVGIQQRFDLSSAEKIASKIRSNGYNARVFNSKGKKRIYVGNTKAPRRFLRRFDEIRGPNSEPTGTGRMPWSPLGKTTRPDRFGSYDGINTAKAIEYVNWKTNAYKNSPDLRYVVVGVNQYTKNPADPLTPTGAPAIRLNDRPYLLSIGLVPSSVALLQLKSLGFEIGPNSPIAKWYNEDRRLRDESWHSNNLRNISYHLENQMKTTRNVAETLAMTKDKAWGSYLGNIEQQYWYEPVYKIGPSDIAGNPLAGGDFQEYPKEGFSPLFTLDPTFRAQRLSDFLPDIHFYMDDNEIEEWISKVNSRSMGQNYDRDATEGYLPNEKSLYREPNEDIALPSFKPNYQKLFDRGYEGSRMIFDDFTYDFLNLQRAQWGNSKTEDWRDPYKPFNFLPYFSKELELNETTQYENWPNGIDTLNQKEVRKSFPSMWLDWNLEVQQTLESYARFRDKDFEKSTDFIMPSFENEKLDRLLEMVPRLSMGEENNPNVLQRAKDTIDEISDSIDNNKILINLRDGDGSPTNISGNWSEPSPWQSAYDFDWIKDSKQIHSMGVSNKMVELRRVLG